MRPVGASLRERGVEHVLALGRDADELRRRFKKQAWQKVKQAERQGLHVREAARADDFLDTYYELHLATRRRQGVPCQPRRFFERLWNYVLEPGHGVLLLAEHDGAAAGGAVFLGASSTLVYKYSASLPKFWALRPNNLLLWTAMQWGIARRFDLLHFGRSDVENRGLRAFKSGWGAEERPLAYGTVGSVSRRSLPHLPGLSRGSRARDSLVSTLRVPDPGGGVLPLRRLIARRANRVERGSALAWTSQRYEA